MIWVKVDEIVKEIIISDDENIVFNACFKRPNPHNVQWLDGAMLTYI